MQNKKQISAKKAENLHELKPYTLPYKHTRDVYRDTTWYIDKKKALTIDS